MGFAIVTISRYVQAGTVRIDPAAAASTSPWRLPGQDTVLSGVGVALGIGVKVAVGVGVAMSAGSGVGVASTSAMGAGALALTKAQTSKAASARIGRVTTQSANRLERRVNFFGLGG